MTNTAPGPLSLGQKKLAKYTYVAATIWVARSTLIRWAHLIERSGLAMVGGSCGLYVAGLMGRENLLFGSDVIIFLIMLYGAFGFYVGIDLPRRLAWRATPRLLEEWNPGDAVELFSAAGTFLAGVAGFLSISIIVLDQAVPDGLTVLVGCCWAIGSTLQIGAGSIARSHHIVERGSE